jgi:hypothetical protein
MYPDPEPFPISIPGGAVSEVRHVRYGAIHEKKIRNSVVDRLYMGLLDPDPGSFYQAKIIRKTLIPIVCDLSKSNKQKKLFFCWRLEGQRQKQQDPEPDPKQDPDPLVRGTDLRIRIRTKMTRIHNTD